MLDLPGPTEPDPHPGAPRRRRVEKPVTCGVEIQSAVAARRIAVGREALSEAQRGRAGRACGRLER